MQHCLCSRSPSLCSCSGRGSCCLQGAEVVLPAWKHEVQTQVPADSVSAQAPGDAFLLPCEDSAHVDEGVQLVPSSYRGGYASHRGPSLMTTSSHLFKLSQAPTFNHDTPNISFSFFNLAFQGRETRIPTLLACFPKHLQWLGLGQAEARSGDSVQVSTWVAGPGSSDYPPAIS